MRNIQKIQTRQFIQLQIESVLLVLMLTMSFGVSANHGVNKDKFDGEVVMGYDVVAYFTMGDAIKGSKDISVEWLGGKWFFVNEEHRELFRAEPAKYVPQYGGYCSSSYPYGDEHDYANPKAWQIVKGKLYLFAGNRTSNRWDSDNPLVEAANKRWEKAKAGLLQQ